MVKPVTFWLTMFEVLEASLPSPLYVAVMGCVPTVRVEIANLAVPLLSVALPIDVPLSLNVAVPVAVEGVTAAEKVTDCPLTEGFRLEVSFVVVVVVVAFTLCDKVEDVLAL